MNEPGPMADRDARTLGRRRRAKRAFVAGYIRELSGRSNGRAARAQQEPRTGTPIEQPQGG
jgi:hypothetical protein